MVNIWSWLGYYDWNWVFYSLDILRFFYLWKVEHFNETFKSFYEWSTCLFKNVILGENNNKFSLFSFSKNRIQEVWDSNDTNIISWIFISWVINETDIKLIFLVDIGYQGDRFITWSHGGTLILILLKGIGDSTFLFETDHIFS